MLVHRNDSEAVLLQTIRQSRQGGPIHMRRVPMVPKDDSLDVVRHGRDEGSNLQALSSRVDHELFPLGQVEVQRRAWQRLRRARLRFCGAHFFCAVCEDPVRFWGRGWDLLGLRYFA